VITDDVRSAGYLASRPEVDGERLGCIGLSLGGTRSAFLGGLESRIQCAVIIGAMSSHAPMIRAHAKRHTWINYVPGLFGFLDFPDVAAMRAPLPLMVEHCAQDDLFPREGMREADEKIRRIYEKAGAPENFKTATYDVPHQFNIEMQKDAFAWLERWLG
jgi:dienelactone hydrolase